MRINKYLVFFLLLFISLNLLSQGKMQMINGKESVSFRFELISNLIVFPVEINGVELSFLLDSGVSRPLLFNITDLDSLQIKNAENIFIRGLGGGEPIKAIQSKGNTFSIHPDVKNFSQDLFVIVDEEINFSPRLGIPIHGIIGYDIFKEFVVKIDYSKKKLILV